MRRVRSLAGLLALGCLAAGGLAACTHGPAPRAVVRIDSATGPVRIDAEVAATDAERTRGLTGRTSLPPGHGMAFVFARPVDDAFWMKGTLIPLSVAVWGPGGRITQLFDMLPCRRGDPCRRYRPRRPWVGAVEVSRGYLAAHGVRIGDRVELAR